MGLLTKRDDLTIDFEKQNLENKIKYFLDDTKTVEEVCQKFKLVIKDNDKWDANLTRANVSKLSITDEIRNCQYRPFDNRKVFYNNYFVARPNTKVLSHFVNKNLGLIIGRQGQAAGGNDWNVIFICKDLADQNIYRRGGGTIFPLYLYPENNGQLTTDLNEERVPNLNTEIVNKISNELNLKFTNEKEKTVSSFSPIDILDYIYAVLHSPTYREKYKEFLKIDFPKIPYPKNTKTFWELVALGAQIREIHLLESPKVEDYITQFNIDGDCVVEKPIFKNGNVYINDSQNFENVPEEAWNFYIGGYQPAQKWLKDRNGRKLEFDDIAHYQKIIVALTETDRIMKEINEIEIE